MHSLRHGFATHLLEDGVEIQDIFAAHMTSYMESHPLNLVQRKSVRNIMDCRTAALGAHIDSCDNCGYTKISYNSCRNRHCPKCQTVAKEKWIDKQWQHLLDIPYFHVAFTIPSELNPVFSATRTPCTHCYFKLLPKRYWSCVRTGNILARRLE